MTSRPPATTTTATATAARPIPAGSRAFAAATGLTAPRPPARITDGTQTDTDHDAATDDDERPANSKEPLR